MSDTYTGTYAPTENVQGTLPYNGMLGDQDYRKQQNGQDDAVHHPSHYASGKYEVIDIIEDQLGFNGLRGFCLGNTIKYICRAGKKDPSKTLEDLEKAEWYLHHCIERMKEQKVTYE